MKNTHRLASHHRIEPLESRIAPASVTLSFFDQDNTAVTVTSSKGTTAELQAAVGVDAGGTAAGVLTFLFGASFKGANITVLAGATATDAITTQIGFFNAAGVDLGKVTIDGGLDRIDAGDSNSSTPALKLLSVGSWGDGTLPTTDGQFDSTVIGAITTLTVQGDFNGAYLVVRGSDSFDPPPSAHLTDGHGKIGTLFIGGSVLGTARENGGHIFATGDITKATVLGSVEGSEAAITPLNPPTDQDFNGRIFGGGKITTLVVGTAGNDNAVMGGDGAFSGQIVGAAGIAKATINGNLQGGLGLESGAIGAAGDLGAMSVTGSLLGGAGDRSGTLLSASAIKSVLVGGDIAGGIGFRSGAIGSLGDIGNVVVTGDIIGGDGPSSGQIVSTGKIKNVTVGNLIGGSQFESGAIGSLKGLGNILIKGDIVAGEGTRSGLITTEEEPFDRIVGEVDLDGPSPGDANAPIASVTVLGSIIGSSFNDIDGPGPFAGYRAGGILSSGKLGPVVVHGGVFGGENFETGRIASSRDITSVKIGGELMGGIGERSGTILAGGKLGPVSISDPDLQGDGEGGIHGSGIIGGDGIQSGAVIAGELTKIDVFGDLRGGSEWESGAIMTTGFGGTGKMGPVYISGSVIGGDGSSSGVVLSAGKLAKIDIFGSVLGGDGAYSGGIGTSSEGAPADMGPVFIARSLIGGFGSTDAIYSGHISSSGKLTSVVIGDPKDSDSESGSLTGGIAHGSGSITSALDMGAVKIKTNLRGGTGDESGKINSGGKLASLTVGSGTISGSIIGGDGNYDTTVESGDQSGQVVAQGAIGSVTVFGDVTGNTGTPSGGAFSAQIRGMSIASVTIHGNLEGGRGFHSGGLVATSLDIGPVVIAGNVQGGNGFDSGFISAERDLKSVKIGESLVGGAGSGSAYVAAGEKLGSFHAAYASGDSFSSRPRISAGSMIGSVTINESIVNTDILAGYNTAGFGVNPDGQIGTVTIGTGTGPGNMEGTNIVAGISAGTDGYFGSDTDHLIFNAGNPSIVSKIASVIVKGSITNSANSTDTFGIVAEHIVKLTVGGSSLLLTSGALNDGYREVTEGSDTVYGEFSFLNE